MAVDRSKFRTCSQTSFCRRHRNGRSKPIYQYKLDPKTIQFHPTHDIQQNTSSSSDASTNAVDMDEKRNIMLNNNEDGSKNEKPSSYMQKIKTMLTGKPIDHESNTNNSNEIDPYVRGPKPFFTATLHNEAMITSTGMDENLNLAIHLHENGVARIRITEEYSKDNKSETSYANARWTSDELILNIDEMKVASHVDTFDASSDKGKDVLNRLLSTLEKSIDDNDPDSVNNYIAFRYGKLINGGGSDGHHECTGSSLFLIQFQPFELHLWRDDECIDDASKKEFGLPLVSVNTDNLMHFEIRRKKEEELKKSRDEQHSPQEEVGNIETIDSEDEMDRDEEPVEPIEETDRHGGKEIVGYWEDGLAIYADGTREERREDDNDAIIAEKRRALMEEQDASDGFHFDTDGMWEEKFGSHIDSKPYGPMSVGADITFPASKHLFGLPEHASSTQLKGTTGEGSHYREPYRLYNLDVFEYELDETMALYGEVPLIVSQSKTSGTVGVFWFNPTETFVDVQDQNDKMGSKTHWISESGVIDLFILPGPNPKTLYQQYASLTGRMPLPPMWSLGYHQCRWNYRDEADVYQVHEKFEELDYPYDVLWLDIEHTDGKRYFTWDKSLFPNPIPMQEKLNSQGRKMVTIIDPHIKRDDNYYIHKTATSKGLYIKDKDGKKDYDGWCWPGSSSYLDFTNEKVRNWWSKQFGYNKYIGSTPSLFTWNDMNEPSVFNGPEVSMQKDLRNLNGVEHREWHNLYGILFQRATSEGLIRRNSDENIRPFVLSRSFFAGR